MTADRNEQACPDCRGSGKLATNGGMNWKTCPTCGGSGRASSPVPVDRDVLDELAREFDFAFTAAPEPTHDDAWADFRAGIERILPLIVKAERERLRDEIEAELEADRRFLQGFYNRASLMLDRWERSLDGSHWLYDDVMELRSLLEGGEQCVSIRAALAAIEGADQEEGDRG